MSQDSTGSIILPPVGIATGDPAGAALENLNTNVLGDGAICYVSEGAGQGEWQLQKGSEDVPDGTTIVGPISGPGRWFLKLGPGVPAGARSLYTVGPVSSGATYQTIAAAIAAVELAGLPAAIIIFAGTYTEEVTMGPLVSLVGLGRAVVNIVGNVTVVTDVADLSRTISGIHITGQLTVPGTERGLVEVLECLVEGFIFFSNSNGDQILRLISTHILSQDPDPACLVSTSAGEVQMESCNFEHLAATGAVLLVSGAGHVSAADSTFVGAFGVSDQGGAGAFYEFFDVRIRSASPVFFAEGGGLGATFSMYGGLLFATVGTEAITGAEFATIDLSGVVIYPDQSVLDYTAYAVGSQNLDSTVEIPQQDSVISFDGHPQGSFTGLFTFAGAKTTVLPATAKVGQVCRMVLGNATGTLEVTVDGGGNIGFDTDKTVTGGCTFEFMNDQWWVVSETQGV